MYLTQALGGKDHSGIVQGVGKYVTKKNYFHTPTESKSKQSNKKKTVYEERDEMAKIIKELEAELEKMKKRLGWHRRQRRTTKYVFKRNTINERGFK